MKYYLDTDICIFALKGQHPSIKSHLQSLTPDRIKIPSIVKAELMLGAEKSGSVKRVRQAVEGFLAPFEIVPFCDKCTDFYSKTRKDLENAGQSIGPNDLIIAATVLAHHGALITHNTKEFSRVSGLKLQDWTKGS